MAKVTAKQNKIIKELPADKAVFVNDEKPYMMYVGSRKATKKGWTRKLDIPSDRVLKQTGTGMFVLGKK